MTTSPLAEPLVVAIDDPLLHPEALHVAAATGRPIVDVDGADGVGRHLARAHAVFVDAHFAAAVLEWPARPGIFLLGTEVAATDAAHASFPQAERSFVLPAQAGELLRAVGLLGAAGSQVGGEDPVIAVLAAAGGVGASTFAASLARTAGPDHEPTLIDAHRYSGGMDLLLGVEEEAGARWGEIVLGEGAVNREDVRRALPRTRDGIAVLTHARTSINDPFVLDMVSVERVVSAVSGGGLTVVDTPVRLMPARCDLAVVVTPAEVRGAAAAARMAAECAAASTPAVVVLRHRGWSSLAAAEVEKISRLTVCAEVGEIRGLRRAAEVSGLPGRLARPLTRAARRVLSEVGL